MAFGGPHLHLASSDGADGAYEVHDQTTSEAHLPTCGGAKVCALCSATHALGGGNLKTCSGCVCVHYCSVACQKRHWTKEHKGECSRMKKNAAALLNPEPFSKRFYNKKGEVIGSIGSLLNVQGE